MRLGFTAFLALTAMAVSAPSMAQAPIAGSGTLPALNPLAQSPRIVVDAIAKVMSERTDKRPFSAIRTCFRESRTQQALRQSCRFRLAQYHREILRKHASVFRGLQPLEVFIRLVELSGDPDQLSIRNDLFALRGILSTTEDVRRFGIIKQCFRDAGPQPAMHQVCGQQLNAFHAELMRTRGIELRDVKPEAVRRRLFQVAGSDSAGVIAGGNSAFNSLRQIRKEQAAQKTAILTAMVRAKPYYCPGRTSPRTPRLASQLASPGVCICTYGRRYASSSAGLTSRPVRVASRRCSADGRFRLRDLNGGRLRHGDWVTLRAVHDGFLSMGRDGVVYANRRSPGRAEKFRLIRAVNQPGRVVAGEMLTLVSGRGVFVVPDLRTGRMKAKKQRPEAHEFFVFTP